MRYYEGNSLEHMTGQKKLGFSGIRNPDLEQEVSRYYHNELPYHNFQHALETVAHANQIIQACRAEHIPIQEPVVYYASLLHDAGYHQDHTARGYPNKEAYSADLAGHILSNRGFPDILIRQVRQAIMATQEIPCLETAEDCAVRAADLFNLAAEYEVFFSNAKRLHQEIALLQGRAIPWEKWKELVNQKLTIFLSQDIPLTEYFRGRPGESVFHRRLQANLSRFNTEPIPASE